MFKIKIYPDVAPWNDYTVCFTSAYSVIDYLRAEGFQFASYGTFKNPLKGLTATVEELLGRYDYIPNNCPFFNL
jgi:hypothetical protein